MRIPVEEYLPAPSLEAEQPNAADVRYATVCSC